MDREERDFVLEKVMIEYGNELVRLAYSYVKDAETAKDMVQNTFIKCYKNLESFRHDAEIKTWLYRITINECKDHLKSWNTRSVRVKSFIHETARSILPSAEKTVLDTYKTKEIKDVVLSLPKMYREVIYLCYYESLRTEEIAAVLGIPLNTVKTRLRRAKSRLETMMREVELNGR